MRSRMLIALMSVAAVAHAEPISVTIDARHTSEPVTQYEYGMFIEPIGGLIARSLWAEMLDDRKFYYPIVPEGVDSRPPQSGPCDLHIDLRISRGGHEVRTLLARATIFV